MNKLVDAWNDKYTIKKGCERPREFLTFFGQLTKLDNSPYSFTPKPYSNHAHHAYTSLFEDL